jgi:hypothetical protein
LFWALAGLGQVTGFITGAVAGHDAGDFDAQAFVISDRRFQELNGADGLFVRLDLGEGDARGVVDADMDEFPANAPAVALPPAVAGNAVANALETPEFLDIDVDQLAGVFPLIALDRLGGLKVTHAA